MSEARYNVVVSGSVLDGFELEQVKAEFAKLFSLAETKAEQIFSSGNVVIKRNVAESSANKLIKALAAIGAAAHLLPCMEQKVPDAAVESVTAEPVAAPQPFIFHGNGFEYFRIWIVNILLTIVTLGIYSAWAKVRNAQYFYGHTEVAGSRFAYLAKPITILKGRLVAVALFVLYSIASNLYPILGAVLAILLVAVLPWIAIRSLRFNLRMTAWRNIRFGFDGSLGEAVKAFILWPVAGVFTLGLLIPYALYKQREFVISNTRYGTARFNLARCGKAFFMIYVKAMGIILLAGLLTALLSLVTEPFSSVALVVGYLYLFVYVSVRSANLIYNNTTLRDGDFGFRCDWTDVSYLKLLLTNTLFTLLTIGFYFPWAMVRVANYKAEHLSLVANEDLDGFVAAEEDNVSALGEEFGDIFDMEVGL